MENSRGDAEMKTPRTVCASAHPPVSATSALVAHVFGVSFLCLAVCGLLWPGLLRAAQEPPFGIDHRIPWTTSRVVGSPDPPLSYTVEKTFTNIQWKLPIFVAPEPNSEWLLVVLQGGEANQPSKILRVRDDPNATETQNFLQISNRLIYSVTFHPDYQTNRSLYVFSHGVTGELKHTNRVSRFQVEGVASPRGDPQSERVILDWHSEGHDGGGIVFGNDG